MIDVAIIDDHPLCARGFELVCKSIQEVKVTGFYNSIYSFMYAEPLPKPNLIILDMQLQSDEGPYHKIISKLKYILPQTNILLVSEDRYSLDRITAFRSGAQGYSNKSDTLESLRYVIENTSKINQLSPDNITQDEILPFYTILGNTRRYAFMLTASERKIIIDILNKRSISSKHGLRVKNTRVEKNLIMKKCGIENEIELFKIFKPSLVR
jgi:DNA-binding NarL/FixJ family response regulator